MTEDDDVGQVRVIIYPRVILSYEARSPAQREARYICKCGAFINLQFALYEE